MQKFVWAALVFLSLSTIGSAETVTVSGDGNVGDCVIPDGSTVTSVSVTPNSESPKLNVYVVDYTFAGGFGETTAVGQTDGHDGSITFLQPVYDLSFDWDAPTAFGANFFDGDTAVGGAGGRDMGSGPMEVQGTATFDGPVTSIIWSGDIFGGGIETLSFDLTPVPEPSTFALLALGLSLCAGMSRKRNPIDS
jgi:PEP-CTERM motif-containing protein